MKKYFIAVLVILVLFALLDGIWLLLIQKDFYNKQFEEINSAPLQPKLLGAVWAYLAMTVVILLFIVSQVNSPSQAILRGALLGLCIYSIYNATNYATIVNYKLETAIIDTLWGTLLFSVTSAIVVYIINKIND